MKTDFLLSTAQQLTSLSLIAGAGGGGGKGGGGSSRTPQESPNTLQSKSIVKLLEALGEGPINGFVNPTPAKSVVMNPNSTDRTPLMAADGKYNFAGAAFDYRLGEPDQTPIKGFDTQVTPASVAAQVTHGGDPVANAVIRRVSDLDAVAAVITIQLDALFMIDQETGDQKGYQVNFAIDVKSDADNAGSNFVERVHERISGKTTSPWQKSYRMPLEGEGPWDIRIRRLSVDEESSTKQNGLSWAILSSLTDYDLSYPNTVLAALTADTEQFGTSIPTRGYEIEGLLIQVPSNYDPLTRTYSGIWNGTFKTAYCNSPPWVFYDIVTNNRYGLGDLFGDSYLSLGKWDLYNIAKYCDAHNARPEGSTDDYDPATGKHGVPDGKGGFEPRFTFNGTFNTRYKAYEALAAVLGMMRTAMMWAGGQLRFMQDRPSQARKVFGPANVVAGLFNYTGTALRARHTAVKVTWKNPEKGYEPDDVLLEDREAIARYGYNLKEETAYGCQSYGQALRHARNILYTERYETDSVQFRMGVGEIDILPGEVFYVEDPTFTTAEWAGRLKAHTLTSVTFDREIEFELGRTYTVTVALADGTITEIDCTNPGGPATTVNLTGSFDAGNQPVENAMFIVSSDAREPRSFRLITMVEEEDEPSVRMVATEYADEKFAYIDDGITEPESPYSDLPASGACLPPTNLTLKYVSVRTGANSHGVLELDWEPPEDFYLSGFVVEYQQGYDEWITMPLTKASNARIVDPKRGPVRVRVFAVNLQGRPSLPITDSIDLSTGTGSGKDLIYGLEVLEGGTAWNGKDLHLVWKAHPAYGEGDDQDDGLDQFFKSFRVTLKDANTSATLKTFFTNKTSFVLPYEKMEDAGLARSYKVSVELMDVNGGYSNPQTITVSNPPPSLPVAEFVAGSASISANFAPSSDPDFVGHIVWASPTQGFTPAPENRRWAGAGNSAVFEATRGVTYYLRYAAYDAFGETGIVMSNEIELEVPFFDADTVGGLNVVNEIATISGEIDDLFETYGSTASAAASASAAETARQAAEDAQAATEAAEANAEQAKTDAQAALSLAQGAQTAAETAEANAEQAKTDAQAARTAAQGARDDAIAQASAAAGSATTAAGHASTASDFADDAEGFATAASGSATTAQTAAGNASASESNAATSETNAAGSASSAATQAGLAASAKDDAEDAATAAATSESNAAASATTAGQYASAANTDRLAAQTARSGAETARNEAVTAKNTAEGVASTATTQAGLAASSATDASDFADASSDSASLASTKADEASQSATSASTSANTATTKAGEASVSAGQAAISETNAAGSASSAATDAGLAATARNEADGFADAASDSASVASAKATEASQSASSATTAANTASTKAGEASASAGQAASSASDAAGSATSASSFATLSASYRDQSLDAATKAGSSLAFNDEFEIVGGWYSGSGQTGVFGAGDYTDTSRGRAIRSAVGSRMTLIGKRIAVDPTRAYRISIDYYCVGGNQKTHVGFAAYDRDGIILSGNSGTHTYSVILNAHPAANQWLQDSAVVQSEGSGHQNFPVGTRYIAPFAYLNYDGEAGARTIVKSFRVDDATETVAAGNSAEAAATSASTATVKAGEAATSATTASNAATTATNKAGEASTSASAAAASATTASTKAGEASASAASALTSEIEAQKSVAVTMPQLSAETIDAFARLWTGDLIANPATGALPLDGSNYWSSDSDGPFYRRTITPGQDYADLAFRKAVKIEQGRTYRCTARARFANYGSASSNEFRVYFIYLDENYGYIGSNHYTSAARSGSYTTISHEKAQSAMPANAVYLRAFYRFMATGHTGNCVSDLLYILFEDVTSVNAAAASAAAASSSATSASADAATATSAKNLAVTYRDQASSSATAAAASATTASNEASAASASATLAATYRDTAERFSEPSLGLNRNSEFDHIGTWSGVHNYANHSNGPGAKSNSGQGMTLFGNKFPVDTSQAYEVSIRLWALDGNARHYVGFAAYDASGNVLPGNTGTHTYTAAGNQITPSQSWVVYSGRMQGEGTNGSTFPSGTKYIAPMAYINYQAQSSGYVWVDWFRITNVDGLVKAETQATIATDQAAIATAKAAAASSSESLTATYRDKAKAYATGGSGLNYNGQFEESAGWYATNTQQVEFGSSQYYTISRGRAIRSTPDTRFDFFGELVPVNTELAYRIRARVFSNTDGQTNYSGYVPYDRNKNRIGTGAYQYAVMSNTSLPAGEWHELESPIITGEGSGSDRFPVGTCYIALVGRCNYNYDPGYTYYSDFTIDEVTDVNELSASVTVNQGAIASIEDTAAFYEVVAAASGSTPAAVRLLAGQDGSAIDLAAERVIIRNPVGGALMTVAEFADGKARLNNALIRGLKVYPRSDSEIALDVQLRPLKFLAKDGDTVSYQNGQSFGASPESIEWDVSGLPAPAAGDSYQAWASNITDTGFTANVKKITSPIQTNRLSTGGVNVGGTPQWQMHKVVSADAHDGNYEFQWDYSVPRTQMIIEEFDPELNRRFYSAFYSGSFDVYVTTGGGNTWTKVQTLTVNHSITGWYNSGQEPPTAYASYNRKSTISTNLPIGTHGGREFGMHPGPGCTILGFDQVFYVSQSNSGTVAVGTAIPWKVYPPAPD